MCGAIEAEYIAMRRFTASAVAMTISSGACSLEELQRGELRGAGDHQHAHRRGSRRALQPASAREHAEDHAERHDHDQERQAVADALPEGAARIANPVAGIGLCPAGAVWRRSIVAAHGASEPLRFRRQALGIAVIAGVILAGGRATRMGGGDKALLAARRPAAPRPCHRAAGAAGRRRWRSAPTATRRASPPSACRSSPTASPAGAGPLAGLLAGLDWAAGLGAEALVTAAVDTPFLPRDLVAAPARRRRADGPRGRRARPAAAGPSSIRPPALWPVAPPRRRCAPTSARGARRLGAWAEAQRLRAGALRRRRTPSSTSTRPRSSPAPEAMLAVLSAAPCLVSAAGGNGGPPFRSELLASADPRPRRAAHHGLLLRVLRHDRRAPAVLAALARRLGPDRRRGRALHLGRRRGPRRRRPRDPGARRPARRLADDRRRLFARLRPVLPRPPRGPRQAGRCSSS